MRRVLSRPGFRRLWLVTGVAATGEWLSLLAITTLTAHLSSDYRAGAFATGGVLVVKLAPSLLMAPLGGLLADRFDRRRVMVVCDLLRFGLFVSIPVVGSLWWLFLAVFLIELCSLAWIPAKESALPNLLAGRDQVETAQQLGLVMTYGIAVLAASGLLVTVGPAAQLAGYHLDDTTTVYVALTITGFAYLLTAATAAFGIRELSGRSHRPGSPSGPVAMLREGAGFVWSSPLMRGLVLGIIGAFTAGGAVIASGNLYARSLGGGSSAYSILFAALFLGLATGMALAPLGSRRTPRRQLFTRAIVTAGVGLIAVALAPTLALAIAAVLLVGAGAGVAFLTGQTIIGTDIDENIRGRAVGVIQSLVRLVLLGSSGLMPFAIGLIGTPSITIGGDSAEIDGTRFLLAAAGLVATALGVLASRQVRAPHLRDPGLPRRRLAALQARRNRGGLLITVQGAEPDHAALHTVLLYNWLRTQPLHVVHVDAWTAAQETLRALNLDRAQTHPRARVLATAAATTETTSAQIQPALARGALVITDSCLASTAARLADTTTITATEERRLRRWASTGTRPDITILLDTPGPSAPATPPRAGQLLRALKIATGIGTAPNRYISVTADGDPADTQQQIRAEIIGALSERRHRRRLRHLAPSELANQQPR